MLSSYRVISMKIAEMGSLINFVSAISMIKNSDYRLVSMDVQDRDTFMARSD